MKLLSSGEVHFDIFKNDALIGGDPLNLLAYPSIQGAEPEGMHKFVKNLT